MDNNFQIGGFQKLSLLDYPNKMCSIIFTNGCNLRCPYCHNYEFVENNKNIELFDNDEIINYLIKRKNVLDGLTISGGEPTLQKGLENFIKLIKDKTSLLIKLDTNGTNPEILKKLIDNNLIDYVAMDIKGDIENYKKITNVNLDLNKILESIKIIKADLKDYEFRTTAIKTYHTEQVIRNILNFLDDDSHYYLQKFIISDNVPDKNLKQYDDKEILDIYNNLLKDHPKIKIRGLKNI